MPLDDFRSIYLPYCLKRQEDGRWIVLNREYKPIGFNTRERLDYAKYPIATGFRGLRPATLKKISAPGSRLAPDVVYLYNDGCIPTTSAASMNAYLGRLALLAKLRAAAPKR